MSTCFAQKSSSIKTFEGRPMPDWIESPPVPHNSSYYFKVFDACDADLEKARNQAIRKAFQQAMTFVSTTVKSDDVFRAIEEGKDFGVISETYSIPIYYTCEFLKRRPDNKYVYWILCQIAVRGNVTPIFNTHFADCNTHEKWDAEVEKAKEECRRAERRVNGTALAASFFVPGAGQMYKGEGGKGTGILLGELALVGGGTTCYIFGKKQLSVMKDRTIEYDAFNSAKGMYNTMRIAEYACFGAAAALYVFNLCHAYLMEPSSSARYRLGLCCNLSPAIIQYNDITTPSYAMGVGMQIKF